MKQVEGEPGELETLSSGKVVAKENGYVYVFTSNESQQDVLFDNMSVYQSTGPILEETHYYPFGMTMAGISTVAPLKLANNYKYNGKELNQHEFSNGTGLEWYSYGFREYDPQIGRFIQEDPLVDQYPALSPYQYAANDPIANIDIDGGSIFGLTGWEKTLFTTTVGIGVGAIIGGVSGGDGKSVLKGAISGAIIGSGASFSADLNILLDIFRTSIQIDYRIYRRSLVDLENHLGSTETKLERWNKRDKNDFKNHFGIADNNSRNLIKERVLKEQRLVTTYLHKGTFKKKFHRTNKFGAGTFAWVYPNDPNHNVHLENQFWEAKRKGQDSKFGTLAHELSHFSDIGGTLDLGYGITNASKLTATPEMD